VLVPTIRFAFSRAVPRDLSLPRIDG